MTSKQILALTPGVAFAVVFAMFGEGLAERIPGPGAVTFAILLAMIVGSTVTLPKAMDSGLRFAEKRLLEVATVGLGFGMQLSLLGELGMKTVAVLCVLVPVMLVIGRNIGQRCGLSSPLALLLAVGNAICGAQAIALVAPLMRRNDDDVGLSVSVVNLFGAVGIFLVPAAAALQGFSAAKTGLLIGGTLPAVGHVVASGFQVSETVGRFATVVKMGRVLLLGPMILFMTWAFREQMKPSHTSFPVPWQVRWFLLACLLGSFAPIPPNVLQFIKHASALLLVVSMAAIGARINLRSFVKYAPRTLMAATAMCAVQLVLLSILARTG